MTKSFVCNRIGTQLKVEKGRQQFIVTGKIADIYFVDLAHGLCERIEEALFHYAVEQKYDIVVAFDDTMTASFAREEMKQRYRDIVEGVSVDTQAPANSVAWDEEETKDSGRPESPRTNAPNANEAVAHATEHSSTREQSILDQVLNRLIPHPTKSFVILAHPEKMLEYTPSGNLTAESQAKLQSILSWATPPRIGHQDTCTILLVDDAYHETFMRYVALLQAGHEDRRKQVVIGVPDVKEIESLLIRTQCRYGLTGNSSLVAKEVAVKVAASGETMYNIASGMAKKMRTPPHPSSLEELFEDGTAAAKRKILQDAQEELEALIGLGAVKEKVCELTALAKVQKKKRDAGEDTSAFSLHSLLLGNPGTGKTVVARILGKIYYALGLRSSQNFIEISAADIASQYNSGEASEKMRDAINRAMGGVLFIDEVYQFAESEWLKSAFANVLMKAMEDNRDSLTVLAAGYDGEELQAVLNINQGVPRRFSHPENTIYFQDYSLEELLRIAEVMLEKEHYSLTNEARNKFGKLIEHRKMRGKMDNAGGVRNLVEMVKKQAALNEVSDVIGIDLIPAPVMSGETIDNILAELDTNFIGLQSVKDQIRRIAKRIERDERSDKVSKRKYNMRFVGNPGTGKTTIARYMSRVFNSLGLIEGRDVIETSPTSLKAGYTGQSEVAVRAVFTKAREEGKVLFIDEAHNFYPRNPGLQDSFATSMLATLNQQMTDRKNVRVFTILAGYGEAMEHLMKADDGLEGRFPLEVFFPDYTNEECLSILELYLHNNQYKFDESERTKIEEHLKEIITQMKKKNGQKFANARAMETLCENIIDNHCISDDHSNFIRLKDVL